MQENKKINTKFFNLKCLVIGDIFIDEYSEYHSNRLSPEAVIPVLKESKKTHILGGAGNVASNLRNLGTSVDLVSFIGKDPMSKKIVKLLNKEKIKHELIKIDNFKTIVKERLVANNYYIARIDNEIIISKNYLNKIKNCKFFKVKKKYDYIILSDYGKGCLNQSRELISFLKENYLDIPIFVDPKGQNFLKYYNADFITPNEKEFKEAISDFKNDNSFKKHSLSFLKKTKIKNLLITRGSYGLTHVSKTNFQNFPLEKKIKVYDVTGAGDTAISVFASSIAIKNSTKNSCILSNLAASSVVKNKGTSSIKYFNLIDLLVDNINYEYKNLNQSQLKLLISQLKEDNFKIGLTNGCFDVLHPGHYDLLNEAKRKCDKLIVAINSDQSIKKLKGINRPYNNIEKRLTQICSLKAVDYVVIFSENTPLKLINIIKPDCLFKGFDYKNKNVVGRKILEKYNGRVVIIPKKFSTSTSKILKNIK